ncbi:MAG: hypothetical protein PUJ59_04145 [Clostridiaceae bacterium]|nr:hypothetical protein [Clostridiaceae bacterium]MDY5889132.1 hypothetical protein [Oscillospiraceae bacterium]
MAEFRTERKGEIIKCEYTVSGGVDGGAYSLRASRTGENTAELAVSNVVNQATFDRERYYDIGTDIFDEVARIVDRYRILRWSSRAKKPVLVNDEEITIVRIVVSEDGEPKAYKISSKQLLPANALKAFKEIRTCMESFAKNH